MIIIIYGYIRFDMTTNLIEEKKGHVKEIYTLESEYDSMWKDMLNEW